MKFHTYSKVLLFILILLGSSPFWIKANGNLKLSLFCSMYIFMVQSIKNVILIWSFLNDFQHLEDDFMKILRFTLFSIYSQILFCYLRKTFNMLRSLDKFLIKNRNISSQIWKKKCNH